MKGEAEMELIDKFIVKEPQASSDYYELFVEGDVNDGDYVSKTTQLSKEQFADDYMLYFISYIATWCGKRWDPRGKFNATKDWNDLFEEADLSFDYLPSFDGQSIHTPTKVRLVFVSDGRRYPVEIPDFDELFHSEDEKRTKVIDARDKVVDWLKQDISESRQSS